MGAGLPSRCGGPFGAPPPCCKVVFGAIFCANGYPKPKKMKMENTQILTFDEYHFVFNFFVFKFCRLQILSPSNSASSNFGYFNTVPAHSTFHALKLPRLTVSLRKPKGNHGGQGIPYRWGGPGELWNVAPERSMTIISSSNFFVFKFFAFKFWRLQNFRFIFRLQIFRFNISLQNFSSSNF